MTMLLSQKYEIFPTKEQKEMLERWLQYCRQTYNSALLDKQRKYKENKQLYTRSDMQKQQTIDKKKYPFLKEVPSQPLQEVFLRLKKAYDGFLSRDANYPKLKKYKDYNSLTFPQFGFKPNGKHRLAMSFVENGTLYNKRLGEIEIHLHRPIEGTIKQLILKRQAKRGYAIFSAERQVVSPSIDRENAVGIDMGLHAYAVLSNETIFENPRFLLQKEKQLKKAQRNLSKKKKSSANYRKQVERIRNMVRNRNVSKSISDAEWGIFCKMLMYKCEKFGGLLVKVDPAYTSQDCSSCGNRVKKSLSIRTHICTKCGTVLDRDHNASLNILQKGLEQLLARTTETVGKGCVQTV
ncbi:transposase (plasmid) [Bacillus cereus]|nr:transposase [Bacillus cereus]